MGNARTRWNTRRLNIATSERGLVVRVFKLPRDTLSTLDRSMRGRFSDALVEIARLGGDPELHAERPQSPDGIWALVVTGARVRIRFEVTDIIAVGVVVRVHIVDYADELKASFAEQIRNREVVEGIGLAFPWAWPLRSGKGRVSRPAAPTRCHRALLKALRRFGGFGQSMSLQHAAQILTAALVSGIDMTRSGILGLGHHSLDPTVPLDRCTRLNVVKAVTTLGALEISRRAVKVIGSDEAPLHVLQAAATGPAWIATSQALEQDRCEIAVDRSEIRTCSWACGGSATIGGAARPASVEGREMTAPNPGIEARLHLVRANRSSVYTMLCRAVGGDLPVGDAVVVVADSTDPVGRELSEAAAEKAGLNVDDQSAQVRERGEIPTAIIVIPRAAAKMIFGASHPSIAAGLDRQPPPGSARVVSVAAGAAMLVHVDVRPTAPIAQG